MGKISELSDDLLVKILSYLPTKVAVSTSVLSKQWQYLWMWLPNLKFGSMYTDFEILRRFLLRNLPLHRAPVIESFYLYLEASNINPEDVKLWIQIAVSRAVRELEILYYSDNRNDILPSSLYTCKSLVTLKLDEAILLDVPRMVCLPSLKSLRLNEVSYENKDSLHSLLSNCPVLEDLSVYGFYQFGKMIIIVPSLQRLSLEITDYMDEFVIDTPSLKYLKLNSYDNHLYTLVKNMPKLKEAFLDVSITLFDKVIRSIQSVKCLTLCLTFDNISEVVSDDVFVFNKLKHLKLCLCTSHVLYVLFKLLKVSPNLRVLELFKMDGHGEIFMNDWNQPSTVPECLLSSLETLKWGEYEGYKVERDVVSYILQNAHCLKTATIFR